MYTGEAVFMDEHNELKSKGKVQRIHKVKLEGMRMLPLHCLIVAQEKMFMFVCLHEKPMVIQFLLIFIRREDLKEQECWRIQ